MPAAELPKTEVPPPLVRLDTFSKSPTGAPATISAFVHHAADDGRGAEGLQAEAAALLAKWALAAEDKEAMHHAAGDGNLEMVQQLLTPNVVS